MKYIHTLTSFLFILAFIIPTQTQAAFGDVANLLSKLKSADGVSREQSYFDFPEDIASDGHGNFYIADTYNHVIRKIASNGLVYTIAGKGGYGDKDGDQTKALFANPAAVTIDSNGNLYVADTGNGKIKKVGGGNVTTIVSGLKSPEGIMARGTKLYVTDSEAGQLIEYNFDGGNKRIITGSLTKPKKLYVRTTGDIAYVANAGTYTIEKVNLTTGGFSTVAGKRNTLGQATGDCTDTRFFNLNGVTAIEGPTHQEDTLYITDGDSFFGDVSESSSASSFIIDAGSVKRILRDANFCEVETMVEDGDYNISSVSAITRYGNNIYTAIAGTGVIGIQSLDDPLTISTWAGKDRYQNTDGPKSSALIGRPKSFALSADENVLYFSENNQIRKYTFSTKQVEHIVGNTIDNYQKNDDKPFTKLYGRFSDVTAIALHPNQNTLYAIDRNNNRLREINIATRSVTYVTGAGQTNIGGGIDNGYQEGGACPNELDAGAQGCAYFSRPAGIAINSTGTFAYIADTDNQVIRRVTLTGNNKGKTALVAGTPNVSGYADGIGSAAKFSTPISLAINGKNTTLFVADRDNHAIRKIDIATGKVTTLTGNPANRGYKDGKLDRAYLNLPISVTVKNKNVFFSEAGTNRVRVADLRDKAVKLVSGSGDRGLAKGSRKKSKFDNPTGLVVRKKSLLVADTNNDMIRRIALGDITNMPYTDAGPGVSAVSPQRNIVAGNVNDTKALQIFGGEFQHGAEAYFGTHKANQTFVNSAGEISVVIPFGHMEPGFYQVRVKNIDGQSGYLLRGYAVSNPDGTVPNIDHWAE